MSAVFEKFKEFGVVPVVIIQDEEDALVLAETLKGAGLPCLEITYRTPRAEASIRAITKAMPDVLVGAGTITNIDQAKSAIEAGAKFLVSPGFNPELCKAIREMGVPHLPGVCTPSEIEQALALGYTTLKYFPAEQFGGASLLKTYTTLYQDVCFVPSGGIDQTNLGSYLSIPRVTACGSSYLVKSSLIKEKKFDEIQKRTMEMLHIVQESNVLD